MRTNLIRMQEFIYEETKYIKSKNLKEYVDLMMECDFMPEEIEDEEEFGFVFHYLVNLTFQAPDFLPPYEYALRIIDLLEPDKELMALQADLEKRWFGACDKIARKEKIFEKQVPWGWMENRPLIRGLYNKADQWWQQGDFENAHELFSRILKTNTNDNIGARYAVKATGERMSHKDFIERFTDETGRFYKNRELSDWLEEDYK